MSNYRQRVKVLGFVKDIIGNCATERCAFCAWSQTPRYEGESFTQLRERGSLTVNYVPVAGNPSASDALEAAQRWRSWTLIGGVVLREREGQSMSRAGDVGCEEFPVGTMVGIVDRGALEAFHKEWRWHHPLDPSRFSLAGHEARVKNVSFYHGGDELYELEGLPGTWHGQCLRRVGCNLEKCDKK